MPRRLSCRREFERAGDLGAADFAQAAALKRAFDREDHRRLSFDLALGDDDAVVGLRHDALARQPRRSHALERIDQFAKPAAVEQCADAAACVELDEAVARQEVLWSGS